MHTSSASIVHLKPATCRGPLSLYVLADGTLSLKPDQGTCPHRAFVISMQKSGTYLVAKILEELGLVDLETHVSLTGFSDYRYKRLVDKVNRAREFTVILPMEVPASLVQEGQFAVGHIPFEWRTKTLLQDFVRVVSIREARDALASMMRFEHRRLHADPLRNPTQRAWINEERECAKMLGFLEVMGGELIQNFRTIRPWFDDVGTTVVRFEELMGDSGRDAQLACIGKIVDAIGESQVDQAEILSRSLNKDTLTYSGARTRHQDFWSDEAEQVFKRLGGDDVNAALGYL